MRYANNDSSTRNLGTTEEARKTRNHKLALPCGLAAGRKNHHPRAVTERHHRPGTSSRSCRHCSSDTKTSLPRQENRFRITFSAPVILSLPTVVVSHPPEHGSAATFIIIKSPGNGPHVVRGGGIGCGGGGSSGTWQLGCDGRCSRLRFLRRGIRGPAIGHRQAAPH